jgi:polyisoprenoid-binding protein YceI
MHDIFTSIKVNLKVDTAGVDTGNGGFSNNLRFSLFEDYKVEGPEGTARDGVKISVIEL